MHSFGLYISPQLAALFQVVPGQLTPGAPLISVRVSILPLSHLARNVALMSTCPQLPAGPPIERSLRQRGDWLRLRVGMLPCGLRGPSKPNDFSPSAAVPAIPYKGATCSVHGNIKSTFTFSLSLFNALTRTFFDSHQPAEHA